MKRIKKQIVCKNHIIFFIVMITTILLYIVQNTVHAYIHYLALLTVCLIQFGADIYLFILFLFY